MRFLSTNPPSIFYLFYEVRLWGHQPEQRSPDPPLPSATPATSFSSFEQLCSQANWEIYSLQCVLGPFSPPLWTRPWGTWTPQLGARCLTLTQLITMASDLEVLFLIPAANQSSEGWRSRAYGANRTTSSAETRSWGHQTGPPHYGCA